MPLSVRLAGAADQARIFSLLHTQLHEHAIQPTDEALRRTINRLIHTPEMGRILVAVIDGEVVGVAVVTFGSTVERGGQSAWLEELYVDPARRGAGIGQSLVRAARDAAQAAGATAIDLEVEAGHERAANLYRREGFVLLERQHYSLELEPTPAPTATPPAFCEGGCLCGRVRYRADSTALDVTHCHCSLCRRSTGAPFVTWATFPRARFRFTKGTPRERSSSAAAVRTFCGDCGTALTFVETARPGSVDVTAGSLDQADTLVPVDHIHVASMLRWLRLADGLPRHAAANPEERDVEG